MGSGRTKNITKTFRPCHIRVSFYQLYDSIPINKSFQTVPTQENINEPHKSSTSTFNFYIITRTKLFSLGSSLGCIMKSVSKVSERSSLVTVHIYLPLTYTNGSLFLR